MKQQFWRCGYSLPAALTLVLAILSFAPAFQTNAQKPATQPTSINDRRTIAAFTNRAKLYVKVRNRVGKKLPPLSKDSTAEQIAARKKAFEEAVRAARAGAKPGEIFTKDAAEYVRRLIRTEFKGTDRREIKETILEAETAGVPLRVNYPYPETKEFSEVPPTLLLKLPQLPKEVNYRFVGHHMLLVDKDNGLILDYMLNALP